MTNKPPHLAAHHVHEQLQSVKNETKDEQNELIAQRFRTLTSAHMT